MLGGGIVLICWSLLATEDYIDFLKGGIEPLKEGRLQKQIWRRALQLGVLQLWLDVTFIAAMLLAIFLYRLPPDRLPSWYLVLSGKLSNWPSS